MVRLRVGSSTAQCDERSREQDPTRRRAPGAAINANAPPRCDPTSLLVTLGAS